VPINPPPLSPALRWFLAAVLAATTLAGVAGLRPRSDRGPEFRPAPNAAKLDPKARLTLVHIADLPPPGAEGLMERFIAEMAALRPAAVLVGGDLVYGETRRDYDFMTSCFRRLEALGISVVVAPGNHERKAWPEYLRHFGAQTNRRVDFGSVSILVLDTGHGRDQLTPSQFRWFKRTLAEVGTQTPVVLMHHPVFKAAPGIRGEAGGTGGIMHGFRKEFIDLCRTKGVAIVLAGHWHCDAVFDATGILRTDRPDFAGTKFVVTTSLGNELRRVVPGPAPRHGYRVMEFEGGRLVRYTEDADGDGQPDPAASRPLGKATP
jgi:UDP-2,3-diacylglucosamine pyrophosphatase LpxH